MLHYVRGAAAVEIGGGDSSAAGSTGSVISRRNERGQGEGREAGREAGGLTAAVGRFILPGENGLGDRDRVLRLALQVKANTYSMERKPEATDGRTDGRTRLERVGPKGSEVSQAGSSLARSPSRKSGRKWPREKVKKREEANGYNE